MPFRQRMARHFGDSVRALAILDPFISSHSVAAGDFGSLAKAFY